jgi:predicted DNA-binding transcriptional regulator YafY
VAAGRTSSRKARRLVRHLRILAAVIREPGLRPVGLARVAGASQRTLFRDLASLRRMGYSIVHSDGYRLQESLGLDDGGGPLGLARAYEEQIRLLREEAPALATMVEAEVDAEAPAALARLFADAIARHVRPVRRTPADVPDSEG